MTEQNNSGRTHNKPIRIVASTEKNEEDQERESVGWLVAFFVCFFTVYPLMSLVKVYHLHVLLLKKHIFKKKVPTEKNSENINGINIYP